MSIFKRISDIITANLNDMMESYEDPEQMLRQATREMEDAIAEAKPSVAKAMAHEKRISKQLASNEKEEPSGPNALRRRSRPATMISPSKRSAANENTKRSWPPSATNMRRLLMQPRCCVISSKGCKPS